jgi:hypothetical protein
VSGDCENFAGSECHATLPVTRGVVTTAGLSHTMHKHLDFSNVPVNQRFVSLIASATLTTAAKSSSASPRPTPTA